MERILFANIGWMKRYKGNNSTDLIKGGGSYTALDKHEAYNYVEINGYCYGYVQPVRWGTIKLEKIDPNIDFTKEYIDNVLVVWTATNPNTKGTFIVGWYKNARVYRTFHNEETSPQRNNYDYNVKSKVENCTLIPCDYRTFDVPRARNGINEGFMGQSNIWYANKSSKEVSCFKEKVLHYIEQYDSQTQAKKKKRKINIEAKKKTEITAIKVTTKAFTKLGYQVISVESENKGWDLEAKKGKETLHIEVKGLSGSDIYVHLSPNEYSKMKENDNGNYRLCVVTETLTKPMLWTFLYENGSWFCEENDEITLSFDEEIATIAYTK